MLNRLLRRHRAAERADPADQAAAGGLPAEVMLIVESLAFCDRGIRDVETGEHRVIAMTADGRQGFDCTRAGAESWLRNRWPNLSDANVAVGVDLLHARMTSYMRMVRIEAGANGNRWSDWRPLEI